MRESRVMTVDDLIFKAQKRLSLPTPADRRIIRQQAQLRQQDIAAVLGIDRATLSQWESGETTPRGDVLDTYAALLERLQREVLG